MHYIIQVSGNRVELHREWQAPWEDEHGRLEEMDECWAMSTDDLKKLIEQAQWCLNHSEAFEKSQQARSA